MDGERHGEEGCRVVGVDGDGDAVAADGDASSDASGGEVVVSGWTEGTGIAPATAATEYEQRGAGAILFTDVDVEGRLGGVQTTPVERIADAVSIPVVASGGVATIEDVRDLRDAGASAVVVGSALYEGRFTLDAAMAAVE